MGKVEIENEILLHINERKNNAKMKARKYLDYAHSFEDFALVDKEYRGVMIDLAKAEFEQIDTNELQKRLKALAKKRGDIAQKHNINLNAFSADAYYTCKLCGDTGFIKGEKCRCYKKLFNEIMFARSEFTKSLPQLSNFDVNVFDTEELGDKLKVICTKYIADFPNVPNVFVLQGTVGVGKSFLVQTIMRELIEKNYLVNYFTAFDFAKTLKDWHLCDVTKKSDYEDLFFDCDLLIVDDLGTEPIYQNVSLEYMQNIFDQRQYLKLPTILVTNLTSDQFVAIYGERLYSRLFFGRNTKNYTIQNSDIRKKIKNSKSVK